MADRVNGYTLAEEARGQGLYFYFREIVSELEPEVTLKDGRRVLMLGSNSYMGLTTHPEVRAAAAAAIEKYGTGTAGSRFLNGTYDVHIALEEELADWVGKESALLFSSGFMVNQGVIATLLSRHDRVLMDTLNHASILDGARLSMAGVKRFPHNDMEALERLLADPPSGGQSFVVVDGVFSMEGDLVRLPDLVSLCDRYQAPLMLDDAHGLGVLGEEGRGTAHHFAVADHVDLIMGTFSKSLASLGGFIAADRQVIEYLKHHSRAFIFSASMPHSAAAAALAALRIIRREPERIERLWENSRMMKSGLDALGFDTGRTETPIIPVYVRDFHLLMAFCRELEREGVFANPVIPPAVAPNQSLVRVSLMATHTRAQVTRSLDAFERAGQRLGLP
jgi:8-amino-7-oxononanoate synthase